MFGLIHLKLTKLKPHLEQIAIHNQDFPLITCVYILQEVNNMRSGKNGLLFIENNENCVIQKLYRKFWKIRLDTDHLFQI